MMIDLDIQNLPFQASGVKVSEEVKQKYDDIKKKKCHRYLVFYIKDEKMIAVEKIGKLYKTNYFEAGGNVYISNGVGE